MLSFRSLYKIKATFLNLRGFKKIVASLRSFSLKEARVIFIYQRDFENEVNSMTDDGSCVWVSHNPLAL